MVNSDLTFITNEPDRRLLERFKVLIKDTRFFDVLVGYFYTSGFYSLYTSLEKTEKIRILIGIDTDKDTHILIKKSQQQDMIFSHTETTQKFSNTVEEELSDSEDSPQVEEGIAKFIEWLKSGKLEIKAYPSHNLHAKLYIMTFLETDRDKGRVITGSSNFTQSGLVDNLEFNVELKNPSDYEFAQQKFNELWTNAIDVKDEYIKTISIKTWLNDSITPYQLYLKFLYEYFQDALKLNNDIYLDYLPSDFKNLEYQKQAILEAKNILEEYGGVFLSDVVGLGKTYISAMLAKQLDGRSLVIAPPVLLDENNPGSWRNVFSYFKEHADYLSIGNLDTITNFDKYDNYKNVFIDEAHRFRSESNITYEKLAQICRGKRVILVTATPYNNSPKDILSLIKLFQKSRKSIIPNLPDLESFFHGLEKRLRGLDRQKDYREYIAAVKNNAYEIREKVLKYLIVRRTRTEVMNYFSDDINKQNIKFPEVANPEPVYYKLNDEEDTIFNNTLPLITNFNYARYTPLLYSKHEISQPDELAQKNMRKFMKTLLVKRLESSFFAFKNSIKRFISYYERFLEEYNKGYVYISKEYSNKIFDLIENDEEEKIEMLISSDKAQRLPAEDFKDSFKKDIEQDLSTLREIQKQWSKVKRDPKLLEFVSILSSNPILKKNKLIVFTESKETAEYLTENLQKNLSENILLYTGDSSESLRNKVIDNFDAKAHTPKDDYRILISTEVLSEGVNLHRSNVIINYDIPWNPTRMMQRVGRINRIDTKFDILYTFNFFPTKQSNDLIKLKEAAEAKIHAFISLLGADAKLLTENENIESHELFNRLLSKDTITGEGEQDESGLKYLQVIRDIRDKNPDLFEKIKRLPKKARTSRKIDRKDMENQLLTYFRKGKIQKFFVSGIDESYELDFLKAAKILKAEEQTPRESVGKDFYTLLEKNKKAFESVTPEELLEMKGRGGRDAAAQVLKILKAIRDFRQFTEEQEEYLKKVITQLEEGGLPKQTTKTLLQKLQKVKNAGLNSLHILAIIQNTIPSEFLESHISESAAQTSGPREVILSEYLII